MRVPKKNGNYKPHGADECGICAKPYSYRKRKKLKEQIKEQFDYAGVV